MLNEIDRSKLYQPTIAIVFLKDILKVEDENGVKTNRLNWREVADIVNYSERQCQNYYYDYLMVVQCFWLLSTFHFYL